MLYNQCLTPFEDLKLESYPEEIKEQYIDYVSTVPYLRELLSSERKRARDLPRDNEGKIIVDITKPHILEDMEYFRPAARHFEEHGCYTKLRPNPSPLSDYGKWVREEIRRCHEGYVRESDGEWIPGDLYFFWNYTQMQIAKQVSKDSNKAVRILSFPSIWEGHYYKYHYIYQARQEGKHCVELAARGVGKSFSNASLLTKRFVLGESQEVNKKVTCYITASDSKFLVAGDLALDKFQFNIDFLAQNTLFPRRRLLNALKTMQWTMGYIDLETGTKRGTLNSVIGVTANDDESKLRGTRGVLYIVEEMGSFPRLTNLYNIMRPSVEDGHNVFGQVVMTGTAGDKDSDFSAAQEFMYNPKGYNFKALSNVYDKEGLGKPQFTFFFPAYLNRARCYDKNGNSDVSKALVEILLDRYLTRHNSTNINAVSKRISEYPITPQEAILQTKGNFFPILALSERLQELDADPNSFNDVYVGTLEMDNKGEVSFKITKDFPIREYPLSKENSANHMKGALEIYQMPEKTSEGKVPYNRYIIGHDPVDNDHADDSVSLSSTIVLDLWTDRIVAEYTGRNDYAEDNYEILRRMCMFYNAKVLAESNKKGWFAYFSKMGCTHYLAETPEYLREKQLIKYSSFGSSKYGVNASAPINNYANEQIREWLLKPVTIIQEVKNTEGKIEAIEKVVPNLAFLKNRALLQELIKYNPNINVDRIRALGMVMLYREDRLILYKGDIKNKEKEELKDYLGNADFFAKNYKSKKKVKSSL